MHLVRQASTASMMISNDGRTLKNQQTLPIYQQRHACGYTGRRDCLGDTEERPVEPNRLRRLNANQSNGHPTIAFDHWMETALI